jgi:aspartyl-tRNA(Asn)/glutamyl-tRNA(Gln) amidotransferase subunit C
MNVDEVKHVAQLARIKLTPEEEKEFSKELQQILDAFSTIKNVNIENTKPSFLPIPVQDNTREDHIKQSAEVKKILANRTSQDNLFISPKIIEK